MGAFEDFLKKQGYVKLDQYGLVLTPDDRILSTRPAVLDDGLGGKIVGWTDGDLAAAELDHWGSKRKAPARPPAVPASPAMAAPATAPARPVARPMAPPPPPVMSPLAVAPTIPQPMFATGTAATKAPVVAAEPPVEEDEWEWEIAMARARAASDDVQEAAASITSGFTAPRKPAMSKAPVAAAAAAKKAAATAAATTAKMLEAKTDPMVSWPKTEELKPGWSETTSESVSPQVLSPQHKALLVAKSTVPRSTPGATVIPVPSLPVAAKPSDVRPLPARTRVARGTGGEDTVQTLAAPANDDHTSPYLTLPTEVKPTGHAGTRRVAAKHR